MITYNREQNQSIPSSAVKIVGLGGAGANMLERIALDSIEGAELLALNTDIRTLAGSLAKEKIQLGVNLTKGLGTGGDPELGQQAMLEAEQEVRTALEGQRIVFLCTGLGGGTGSGAAPIVSRIAREEGAFVVVFATMPFFFEGRRRREQAETSLNQLAVLSNALVTFDNNRMGELVLAKQGIHEAFAAADKMISESIKAVIRLVIRPGLINVGLDDLMSALRTNRSRCLFGSGIAEGKDRASKALRNALSSPLLDQGALLKEAQTVLVHLSGGESLTLFEIELLMQSLQKHVPENAQVLFGAAIDPMMGDNLSITLISALPEDELTGNRESKSSDIPAIAGTDSDAELAKELDNPFSKIDMLTQAPVPPPDFESVDEDLSIGTIEEPVSDDDETLEANDVWDDETPNEAVIPVVRAKVHRSIGSSIKTQQPTRNWEDEAADLDEIAAEPIESEKEDRPFAEPELSSVREVSKAFIEPDDIAEESESDHFDSQGSSASPTPGPKNRTSAKPLWGKSKFADPGHEPVHEDFPEEVQDSVVQSANPLRLDSAYPSSQSELSFEKAPRGRFEGENPNVFDGEDLDLPPFLRKKKS
ncbi:MAG: hypothetical protein H7Y36_08690 [Armatimonadetes bacterium]|nr:hypothetical protein [Akkermansiaceae bacterium]